MRKRVAFITGAGYLTHWCGVCESCWQIISKMNPPPHVITTGENTIYKRLAAQKIPVSVSSLNVTFPRHFKRNRDFIYKMKVIFFILRYIITICGILLRNRINVVYFTDSIPLLFAFLPVRLMGIRIWLGIRGTPGESFIWSKAYKYCYGIIVLSNEMKDVLLKNPHNKANYKKINEKVHVIYNGIDFENVGLNTNSLRKKYGIDNNKVILLYIAAFWSLKNQLLFIQNILGKLENDNFCCIFAGDAKSEEDKKYYEECKEITIELGIEKKVIFAGFVPNVSELYSIGDIVCLASLSEGQPRAVLEGMAWGKPVITYSVLSVYEMLVPSNAGFVIPDFNEIIYTEKLNELINNKELRLVMGDNGKKFAINNFDIIKKAAEYENLFYM